MAARVISACDAFNAMTTDRPYRDALTLDVAISELRDNAGTQFDPAVVETLVEVVLADDEATAAEADGGADDSDSVAGALSDLLEPAPNL